MLVGAKAAVFSGLKERSNVVTAVCLPFLFSPFFASVCYIL